MLVIETATCALEPDLDAGTLALSPDGSVVAVSARAAIHLYASDTGERLQTLAREGGVAGDLQWLDARTIARGHADGERWVWDITRRRALGRRPGGQPPPARARPPAGLRVPPIDSSADDPFAAVARRTRFGPGESARLLHETPPEPARAVGGALPKRGPLVIFAAQAQGRHAAGIVVADLERRRALATWREHGGGGPEVRALAASPDGTRLASGGGTDALVLVWELARSEVVATLAGHSEGVSALAWGPQGRLGSAGDDGTVRVWDVESRRERRVFRGLGRGVGDLSFSPDGVWLAWAARGQLYVWREGALSVESVSLDPSRAWPKRVPLVFGPGGALFVGARAEIQRWSPEALDAPAARWPAPGVTDLAIDRAGTRLAGITDAGALTLWSLPDAHELWRRDVYPEDRWVSPAPRIAWSPKGASLVAVGLDTLGARVLGAKRGVKRGEVRRPVAWPAVVVVPSSRAR